MRLELAYGRGRLEAELSGAEATCESRAPLSEPADGAGLVAAALDAPLGLPPLAELARGARRAVILISGEDRVAGASVYVPVIVQRLVESGLPESAIGVVCATGTHVRHTPEQVRALIGDELAARVRFRAHDCDEQGAFVDLGSTTRGTPVCVARDVVEADLRILTGRVAHHYFAGFSGGRKSILPGVSARETILANHRLVLEYGEHGCRVHPQVAGGQLAGNPVHEDMLEAARRVGPVFVVNTLVDGARRLSHVFAGELEAAHLAACEVESRVAFHELTGRADLVVASSGGWPYDINFVQALKALFNHRDALAPGGTFVLVAEAAGGVLKGLRQWMSHADPASLRAAIASSSYNLAAHNSLMLRELLASVTVVLVSALHAEDVRALGLVPAADLAEGLARAHEVVGAHPQVRVVHDANVTQSGFRRGAIRAVDSLARAS